MECPVALSAYEEDGDMQPVMLPACGHTISREAAKGLLDCMLAREKDARVKVTIKCPACNTKQLKVKSVNAFPPNWTVIQHVRDERERREQEQKAAASATLDGSKSPSTKRKRDSFGSQMVPDAKAVPMGSQAHAPTRLDNPSGSNSRQQRTRLQQPANTVNAPVNTSSVIDLTFDSPEEASTSIRQAPASQVPSLTVNAPGATAAVPQPVQAVPQQSSISIGQAVARQVPPHVVNAPQTRAQFLHSVHVVPQQASISRGQAVSMQMPSLAGNAPQARASVPQPVQAVPQQPSTSRAQPSAAQVPAHAMNAPGADAHAPTDAAAQQVTKNSLQALFEFFGYSAA